MPTRPPLRDSVLIAAAFAAVAVTVVLLRAIPGVNPTTAGFALLIVVQLAATLGPLWIAITIAVASTLSFNYFFFPPVGTFSISEPHNWVALFAFLVTALIGSQLSAAAQERARMADARALMIEEREAAEVERQRGELAATLLASLSHDLKTPLTVIRTAVDNLRDTLPPDIRRAQADAAAAELSRLTRLFEDILDIARIDAAADSSPVRMGHAGRRGRRGAGARPARRRRPRHPRRGRARVRRQHRCAAGVGGAVAPDSRMPRAIRPLIATSSSTRRPGPTASPSR